MRKDELIAICGSEQEYQRVVEHVASEFLDLARWVSEDSADSPLCEDLNKYTAIALAWLVGDCDAAWRRLATYTLTRLDPRDDLTPEQKRIRAIAESIYRTEKVVARRLGIDLYPKDSERAYERAVEELKTFLEDKEIVQ
jgi:hypothetical protein